MDPVSFLVQLTPKGRRDAVEGWAVGGDGVWRLRVRVRAPPVDGAANAALTDLIATVLNCSRGDVRIVSGDHGRRKRIEVRGVAEDDLSRTFGPHPTAALPLGARGGPPDP